MPSGANGIQSGGKNENRIILARFDDDHDGTDVGSLRARPHRCAGPEGHLGEPIPRDKPHTGWASRLLFAHDNTVENLVVFGILVLILDALVISTPYTVMACAVYFWARLAYAVIYAMGIPVLRTLAFTIGFLAQVVLALTIFRLI